jgi:hypothetical protein
MRSSSLRLALFSAAIFFAGINLGFAETQPAQTAGPRIHIFNEPRRHSLELTFPQEIRRAS